MLDSKPCATSCLSYKRILLDNDKPYNNPASYRSLVGALPYLTFTRPDITFAVHQGCQFMHNPMESLFITIKKILRYLKGTINLEIHYVNGCLDVRTFSNSD